MKLSCKVEPNKKTYYVELTSVEKDHLIELLTNINTEELAMRTSTAFVQTELAVISDPHDRPNEVADRLIDYLTGYAAKIKMIGDIKALDRM
jgi:hypothetical protein